MIRASSITILISLALLIACTNDPETCYSNSDTSFTKAVALKLDELDFSYVSKKDNKLCYNLSKKEQFTQISNEVNQYYRAVATVLTSQKDKEVVFSWLKESGTPYSTHENNRGTFIAIGSLTEELATENAIKLNELVYGQ